MDEETGPATPDDTGVVPAEAEAAPRRPGSPLPLFLGMLAAALLSFGGPALVLSGTGRTAAILDAQEAALKTNTPARTHAGATTPATAATRVRVLSTRGSSQPTDNTGRQHEVTFVWVLEGARENDPIVIQFYSGTNSLGQQTGTLDPSVFSFSTNTLSLTAQLDCSTGGWSAEILTIRGATVDGEAEARVPGVTCP